MNTKQLKDIIAGAIARSISHDEIVRVVVADRDAAADAANALSEWCDSTETEDMSTGRPMTDIWGDTADGAYRLYLVTE